MTTDHDATSAPDDQAASHDAADASSRVALLRERTTLLVPDAATRRRVLDVFAEAILAANGVLSGCWGAGSGNDNLRINVSSVQVLRFGTRGHQVLGSDATDLRLILMVDETLLDPAWKNELAGMLEGTGRMKRATNALFVRLTMDQLDPWVDRLLPAFRAAIVSKARWFQHGRHDRAVVDYLREETGRDLPHPTPPPTASNPPPSHDPVTVEDVATRMAWLIPEETDRRAVIAELVRVITAVHAVDPRRWAVLYPKHGGINVMIGWEQALAVWRDTEQGMLSVSVAISRLTADERDLFEPGAEFKRDPDSAIWRMPSAGAGEWFAAHREAVDRFVAVNSARMGASPHQRLHTPAVVDYLARETEHALSQPGYVDDPSTQRYWKISAGAGGKYLSAFLAKGVIAVGCYDAPIDLAMLAPTSAADIAAAFGAEAVAEPGQAQPLWRFYSGPRPGDVVYVHHGGQVLARGEVTSDYHFAEDDLPYHHRRAVEWEPASTAATAALPEALRKKLAQNATLVELDAEEAAAIDTLIDRIDAPDLPDLLARAFASAGLHYTPWQQAVFVTALQTKGFVILSGISGTGKTKIAQALAAALPTPADGGPTSLFVTVRPDWRDSTALLGYHNPITDAYVRTPLLDFLQRAIAAWEAGEPAAFVVILDEMNLAHVEHYFAEVLSILESGRDDDGWSREAIALAIPDGRDVDLPRTLRLPPNLHIVGTVNLDETTHAFSPKVLDRAFAMELTAVDFRDFPPPVAATVPLDPADRAALLRAFSQQGRYPRVGGAAMREAVAARLAQDPWLRDALVALNDALDGDDRLRIGYRVFEEIVAFVDVGLGNGLFDDLADAAEPAWAAFDAAATMKLLPRFHGSRARLERPVVALLDWCRQPTAPTAGWAASVAAGCGSAHDLSAAFSDAGWALPRTADRALRLLRELWVDGFAAYG